MKNDEPVFTFMEEGRDDVHAFVSVSVGRVKAGQLCFRRDEWASLCEILAGCARVELMEYEPWPGE